VRLQRGIIWCSAAIAAALAISVPAASAATASAPRPIAAAGAGQAGAASPAVRLSAASGSNDFLDGDSCTRGGFCMTVGSYTLSGTQLGLSEMLSGGSWTAEPVPSPTTGPNVFGNEVSCASPASCLFVGEHWAGKDGHTSNLAESWNGSSWRIVATAGPARSAVSGLDDVACPTTKFCLAVGYGGAVNRYQDTAYTLANGTTWRRISTPKPSGARWSELGSVACSSASNCMAVGNYENRARRDVSFAARWHSGRWQLEATPGIRGQRFASFEGISCPTATLCMAVGNTEDKTREEYYHAFADVWSGGKWHLSTLGRSETVFYGASCPSKTRCFAAGYGWPSKTSFAHTLIETWTGRSWRTQRAPETSAPGSGDVLADVSCVTQSDCEAVGYSFVPNSSSTDQTLAERWNGDGWAVQATVNP
jgi:hypothetical protein